MVGVAVAFPFSYVLPQEACMRGPLMKSVDRAGLGGIPFNPYRVVSPALLTVLRAVQYWVLRVE